MAGAQVVSVSGRKGGANETSSTRVFVNRQNGSLLSIGDEEFFIPAGFTQLEIQPRMCGDHYAIIDGPHAVCGYGPLPIDAVKMALGKIA